MKGTQLRPKGAAEQQRVERPAAVKNPVPSQEDKGNVHETDEPVRVFSRHHVGGKHEGHCRYKGCNARQRQGATQEIHGKGAEEQVEEEAAVQCADKPVRHDGIDQCLETVLETVICATGLEGHPAEDVGVPQGCFVVSFFIFDCESVERSALTNDVRCDICLAFYDVSAVDEDSQHCDDQTDQGVQDDRMKATDRAFMTRPVRSTATGMCRT